MVSYSTGRSIDRELLLVLSTSTEQRHSEQAQNMGNINYASKNIHMPSRFIHEKSTRDCSVGGQA